MHKYSYSFFSLLFLLSLLVGCGTVTNQQIAYYRLSKEPFPALGEAVMLVNNAVEQPINEGTQIIFADGNTQRVDFMPDSVAPLILNSLANYLYDSKLMQDVTIYTPAMRADSNWRKADTLKSYQLDRLFRETDSDWVLSLDLHYFQAIVREQPIPQFHLINAQLEIVTYPILQLYKRGEVEPVSRYYIKDTLQFTATGGTFHEGFSRLPHFANCMKEAAHFAGERIYQQILPYVEQQTRYYVHGVNAAMREASYFLAERNYEDALSMWTYVYEEVKGKKNKQHAAYNMALLLESQQNFEEAIAWIERAIAVNTDVEEIGQLRLENYRAFLKKRMREQRELDKLGIEYRPS